MVGSAAHVADSLFMLPEIRQAIASNSPVVALESAVITHGLPFPRNLQVAKQMEATIGAEGVRAATVAVLDGRIHVGLTQEQMQVLATSPSSRKVGPRDFSAMAITRASGGTTVAATLFAARRAGISVFATGGIGGVHRESPYDVSADLTMLAETPMIVVCAGAKAILDLQATLEILESRGVPVIGLGTSEFPAFYSRDTGLEVSARVESAQEVAELWRAHSRLGQLSAILVANPVPEESAIPRAEVELWIAEASAEATREKIRGQALTPFLLERLAQLSRGRTINSNIELLVNNARAAAQIAKAVADRTD